MFNDVWPTCRAVVSAMLLLAVTAQVSPSPVFAQDGPVFAQDDSARQNQPGAKNNDGVNKIPLAKFVTVDSPIDDQVFRRVRNTGLKLQEESRNEERRAFLILEIKPGNSEFHQVLGLARFLTSADMNGVTTIAWVPETVVGYNTVVALACNEIVMHPDAMLGDIGRGRVVPSDDRQSILQLVDKRQNAQVNRSLAIGMMDPRSAIRVVTIQGDDGVNEKRVVTPEESKLLSERLVSIIDTELLKEAGEVGRFSGQQARNLGILVSHTATSRVEIVDLYGFEQEALREDIDDGEQINVQVIKLTDVIEPKIEAFTYRQIDRAIAEGANLIIFEVDSPGGSYMIGMNMALRIAELADDDIRTVAYIPKQAYSMAAIISLSCDQIFMHKDAQLGDAGIIRPDFENQVMRAVPEKLLSPLRQTLKTFAEKKNRPKALLEAMSFKDLVVYEVRHRDNGRIWYMSEDEIHESNGEWIKQAAVPESAKDLLVTVTGDRAVELKLATAVVQDMDDLKTWLNIPPEVKLHAVERTWIDNLIFTLTTPFMTGLLLFLALVCIYIELHFMTGFFGILSALCFSVFFWSKFLGGTAGWLEVILFVLGVGCILMEVFVIPGFGVFGISGGLFVLGSLVMASQTFSSITPAQDMQKLTETIGTLSGSVVAVVIFAMLMSHFLPRIPIFNQMILTPENQAKMGRFNGPQLDPELTGGALSKAALIGKTGAALSILRPSGKAKIDGEIYDVVSEGPFIQAGTEIEVINVEGNRIVIREQKPIA